MFTLEAYLVPLACFAVVALLFASVRILREYERAVVFTLGRFQSVKGPGLMVLPGSISPEQPTTAAIAGFTRRVLRRVVPAEVPGGAFLSGGQSGGFASARLNAMNASPSPKSARARIA